MGSSGYGSERRDGSPNGRNAGSETFASPCTIIIPLDEMARMHHSLLVLADLYLHLEDMKMALMLVRGKRIMMKPRKLGKLQLALDLKLAMDPYLDLLLGTL